MGVRMLKEQNKTNKQTKQRKETLSYLNQR